MNGDELVVYRDGVDVVSVVRRDPCLDLAAMLVGYRGVIVDVHADSPLRGPSRAIMDPTFDRRLSAAPL